MSPAGCWRQRSVSAPCSRRLTDVIPRPSIDDYGIAALEALASAACWSHTPSRGAGSRARARGSSSTRVWSSTDLVLAIRVAPRRSTVPSTRTGGGAARSVHPRGGPDVRATRFCHDCVRVIAFPRLHPDPRPRAAPTSALLFVHAYGSRTFFAVAARSRTRALWSARGGPGLPGEIAAVGFSRG